MGTYERAKAEYARKDQRRSIGLLRKYFGEVEVMGEVKAKKKKKVKNTAHRGSLRGIEWEQIQMEVPLLNAEGDGPEKCGPIPTSDLL